MRILPLIYLTYMFIGLYMTSFFLILYFKNRKTLFNTPTPNRHYNVSVLIPAYNEEDTIEDTIKAVLASKYPLKEVIVINDGSKDRTKEIVQELMKKYSKLKLLDKPNSGKADSINCGFKMAEGELVVVVDADGYPASDAIDNMVGYFNDEKMAAVTALITPKNRNNFIEKLQTYEYPIISWTRKLLGYVDGIYVNPGAMSMYRKEAILKVGGFDTTNMTEDIEMTWKLTYYGYHRGVSLTAKDKTEVPSTLKKWWKQRVRWNLGGLQTIMKYKSLFLKKGMLGCFILPFFVTSLLLGLIGLSIFTYLIIRRFIFSFLITTYSFEVGVSPITFNELNITPTVLNFLGIALFALGLFFTYFGIISVGESRILRKRNIFNLLFYLIVYLTIYPTIMIVSIYKYLKGDIGWGTKDFKLKQQNKIIKK
ncbi:MAG: glycosyltransferase [Candidatus Pacearchaeota archaeon]